MSVSRLIRAAYCTCKTPAVLSSARRFASSSNTAAARSRVHVQLPRPVTSAAFQHRWYVSSTTYKSATLTAERYHRISDKTLDHLCDYLEALGDEVELDGFDLEYAQGVMTIKLGEHGTYVINKQPPNQQIWLSSPKSGPVRYDYDEEHRKWFYHRDNHTLDELLNKELSEVFNRPVDVTEAIGE